MQKTEADDCAAFEYEAPPEPAPQPKAEVPRGGGAEGLVQQLRGELSRVNDPHVRALLLAFLDDPEIAPGLRRAPAAKGIHHAYRAGSPSTCSR